jgi:transcriptional regulator with XRE-family HTH domain
LVRKQKIGKICNENFLNSKKQTTFANKCQDLIMSTIFGNKIKTLREEKQIPQRQLASVLEIDTATYCKIEKGDRRAKREQVNILAKLLEVDSKELIRLWSADKVYDIIAEEEEAAQILNVVAESIVEYKRKNVKI